MQTEELERAFLHPSACLSAQSKGRPSPEPEGDIRTCFQRDRDRIIHAKSFRRLKQKTQVFLAPRGDHYRTRLTHVLEVSQIARTIARALRLNEDLTEAISLGHDLGHTPFGHAGEEALKKIHPGGFDHHQQSLRVVDVLEKNGNGLNLSHEVRMGIVRHSKGRGEILPESPAGVADTHEGMIVRVSDIIAYVNHDLDDALRAGIIKKADIPIEIPKTLGQSHSQRIDAMVRDVIYSSLDNDLQRIQMSDRMVKCIGALRDFLFERVYKSDSIVSEFTKAMNIVTSLYERFLAEGDLRTHQGAYSSGPTDTDRHQMACDFIAGMTDQFAIMTYEKLFVPQQWTVL